MVLGSSPRRPTSKFQRCVSPKRNRGIAQQVEQRSPKPRVPSSILGAPAKKKVLSDSDKTFFISLQKESTALIAKIVSQSGGFLFKKFIKWEQLKTELLLPKVFSVWTCKKSWVFRMVALASSLNKNQSGQPILWTDNGKRKRRTKNTKGQDSDRRKNRLAADWHSMNYCSCNNSTE